MRRGKKTLTARRLRQSMSDAERRMWFHLRHRASGGWKFRRQCPVGPYVVDFLCAEAGLVVEVDGSQHLRSDTDVWRTRFLSSRGLRVLRFWNDEVLLHTPQVLEAIHAALERAGVR